MFGCEGLLDSGFRWNDENKTTQTATQPNSKSGLMVWCDFATGGGYAPPTGQGRPLGSADLNESLIKGG